MTATPTPARGPLTGNTTRVSGSISATGASYAYYNGEGGRVGLLADRREARRREAALVAAREAQNAWREKKATIEGRLASARDLDGDAHPTDVLLKPGERLYLTLSGAPLVENRRGQGHYVAGYSGVSVPIGGTRARVHLGGARGHYVPGQEADAVVDVGTAYLTDRRFLFVGARVTREWALDKLVAVTPMQLTKTVVYLQLAVTNRQKPSGIAVPEAQLEDVDFVVNLVLAQRNGTREALAADLQRQLDALGPEPSLPAAPAPAIAAAATVVAADARSAAGVPRPRALAAADPGWVFRPPPGWPPPPPGWRPPEGWKPDISWPPAPADWVWWSRP